MSGIASRLAEVRGRIARAAERAGREPSSVRLVAVSKRQPAEAVREAWEAGQREFGENYAQELAHKAEALAALDGLRWHMIGHLQSNKARLVAPHVAAVHTIDSPSLARELGKRAATTGRTIDALVEVNVARDPAKSGCALDALEPVLAAIRAEPSLRLVGLMTMPPYTDDPDAARPFFAALRELRARHGGAAALPELSMGMSHDLEAAIAEGATIVRVGTAIFGERPR